MVERIRVNFPAGRMVQGDLYKANDTDFVTKQKRVYPAGHRLAGQPKITYFFALAVKKNGEQHWAQTPWGQQIWNFGNQAWPRDPRTASAQFPQGISAVDRPDFAWKIEDGDSTVPNKNNRINARTEGFAGCWIISFSSVYPPKIITTDFTPITEPNAVKRGFWIEPVGTVDTNESQGNPGIYINGEFVMFRAIDKEISGMVDPRSIQGFGQSALPAGVTPVGSIPPTGGPTPFGMPAPPSPQFPTPGAPLPPAGFGGAPNVPQPPVPVFPGVSAPSMGVSAPPSTQGAPGQIPTGFAPGFPSSPPQMPPGVTSVPGFLPNAPPAPQMAPAPGFQPPGAALAVPGPNGYAQYGAPSNGSGVAAEPVLTAKCPPGLTWAMMQQQGWTVENARTQGYIQ